MTRKPSILVITLHSGENEFDQCRDALEAQDYQNWEHKVYSFLPNKEAHEALYTEIMTRREHDLFIKLDADMVFTRDGAMAEIVAYFSARPDLDHAMFAVHDYMSDSSIMGLHVFSNRATWPAINDRLFVDPIPTVPGRRQLVWRAPAPFVHHSPDPSPLQAFRFGVHRALKAYQPGRALMSGKQAVRQWRLLTKVWDHFERTRDRRLGLAILGAELVRTGDLCPRENEYAGSEVEEAFESYGDIGSEALYRRLNATWSPKLGRFGRWALSMGPRVFVGASFQGLDRLRS